MYLIVQTTVIYTYRPIVDERNVHHGSKEPILDLLRFVCFLHVIEKSLIELLGFKSTCGLMKARLAALLHGCKERKLRDWCTV
jgi:hypothetical protein